MFLKKIVSWWAGSKLEKETAHTQSMVRELEAAQVAANRRIKAKSTEYKNKIIAHQERRNKELQKYLEFMNGQLEITGSYLEKLANFQEFTFTCIDSWMYVDLCNQELNIVKEKINAIYSTTSLIDAYINELIKQSQRQGRHAWRTFTGERELPVMNEFIESTQKSITRSSKLNNDDFSNELNRLRSYKSLLLKNMAALKDDQAAIFEKRDLIEVKHKENKEVLCSQYDSCVESWIVIAKKFEAYYAFELTNTFYGDLWLKNLKEGGTLSEIKKVIGTASEIINCANEVFRDINQVYQPIKRRIQIAHDTKEYPDSFNSDKVEKNRLAPLVSAAHKDKSDLMDGRAALFARRDELQGYIDRIGPLHPDTAIESICDMLSADREFNAWHAFGFNTNNQKRMHWEKKNKGYKDAATN